MESKFSPFQENLNYVISTINIDGDHHEDKDDKSKDSIEGGNAIKVGNKVLISTFQVQTEEDHPEKGYHIDKVKDIDYFLRNVLRDFLHFCDFLLIGLSF